jgi:GxxExxY protein
MTGSATQHDPLTQRVIGAAMEVHRVLGPGYLETVYEQALAYELELQTMAFRRQTSVAVLQEKGGWRRPD